MSQVSEVNQGTNDAASSAPVKSLETLDDSNLVTECAAAARKCPECEALMRAETVGPEKRPGFVCPECTHEEEAPVESSTNGADNTDDNTSAAAPEPREVRCETCGLQLVIEPLPSGHGFKVISGADPGQTFGSSPNGFPICPTDGVALIPIGPVPVEEAFRGVQDALQAEDKAAQRLPFPAPAFNAERALHAIFRQNAEVEGARRRYDDLKERASAARKELDEDERLLGKMISEYARNEQDAQAAARGTIRPGQASICLYEQRTGEPCHVCRDARRKACEAGDNDANQRMVSVTEHARRRGLFLEDDELVNLERDQPDVFAALETWAHDETVKLSTVTVLSQLVKHSCIAGPMGDDGQRCMRCSMQLFSKKDEADDVAPYPEGASVGLNCAGAPGADVDEEQPAPEPARQITKRHKSPKDAAAAKSKAGREKKPRAKRAKK